MSIDVSPAGIDAAAKKLEGGSSTIEGTSDAPTSVDAGEMSAMISTILSGMTRSVGVIVDEVEILAANAHASAADYRNTDNAVAQSLK